jgi:hypothetical protein
VVRSAAHCAAAQRAGNGGLCHHYIVDEHPELANALDHARRYGEWIADT